MGVRIHMSTQRVARPWTEVKNPGTSLPSYFIDWVLIIQSRTELCARSHSQ